MTEYLKAPQFSSTEAQDVVLDRYQQEDSLRRLAGTRNVTGAGTVGTSAALTGVSRTVIKSETDASGAADSGTGTIHDPYVFSAKSWDNSEATTSRGAFYWEDQAADYHILIEDFEAANYNDEQIGVVIGPEATLRLKNGSIWTGTGSSNGVNIRQGKVFAHGIEFAGCDSMAFNMGGIGPVGLYAEDIECNERMQTWGSVAYGLRSFSDVEIYVDGWTQTVPSLNRFCQMAQVGRQQLTARNVLVANTAAEGIYGDPNDPPDAGIDLDLENFIIRDTGADPIRVHGGNDCRLVAGNILDPAADSKKAFFKDCDSVHIERCRFSDANGDGGAGGAGEELTFASNCGDVVYKHLWGENASEDAFEVVDCGSAYVKDVGAVNVAGQIVDVFGTGNRGRYVIEDVCGQGREGILITDSDGVVVRGSIATRTDHPPVKLEQRNGTADATPADCFIACKLPPAEDANTADWQGGTTKAEGRLGIKGDIGANNLVTVWDGDLRREVDVEAL